MSTVRRDFFLDPAKRLSEQERALMTSMLHDLVETLAGDVLAALPRRGTPPADAPAIIAALTATDLIDRAELVALLLRRADEQRIATAFTGRAGPRRLPLLPTLVGDGDGDIAAAAMALVVARGRRKDPFGQPRVELSDIPVADAEALVHSIAAALTGVGPKIDDAALAAAAAAVLARHDDKQSLDASVTALVEALDRAGRADEALIEISAEEGEAAILAELLARRASIAPAIAWDHLVNGDDGRLALLARMADLGRQTAARLFAELGALTGAAAADEEIGRFDALVKDAVLEALAWWRLPKAFRQARAVIRGDRG